MTRVKICGLTSARDRDAAVAAGADALGFIAGVPVDTHREVDPGHAADLVAGAPPFVTAVLVTMPDDPEDAIDLQERVGADALQLHGDLPPADVARVREATGADTLVAVDAEDPDPARFADAADALLVDSLDEAGGGGTGETYDWSRARALREKLDVPVVLAGGLDPGNVAGAVRAVEPHAVDVATGVENADGGKDHDAVRAFVRNAKRAPEVAP